MPYVLGYEPYSLRPTKRRRLEVQPGMDRGTRREEQCQRDKLHTEDVEMNTQHDRSRVEGSKEADMQLQIQTSDREELIQCIKRGQRPTWVPKAGLRALHAEEEAMLEKRNMEGDRQKSGPSRSETSLESEEDLLFGPWTKAEEPIERPRSALHAGNFDEDYFSRSDEIPSPSREDRRDDDCSPSVSLSESPPSWLEDTRRASIGYAVSDTRALQSIGFGSITRRRAPSLGSSLSSSFVMRVPTSPLVNAVSNLGVDFSPTSSLAELGEDHKQRRRTLPPSSLQSYGASSIDATPPNFSRPLPHPTLRRESSLPYQTHQPRRSLGSFTYQSTIGGQIPKPPIRSPSFASDLSPRQRMSMVGSFEESILRGRMSSPASKPFDFVAHIGVMGKGDCPANLKCPAHVSVPFQAVFYNYPSLQFSRSIADDAPSPYVGTIDIERNLKPVQLAAKRKRTSIAGDSLPSTFSQSDPRLPENTPIGKALARDAQLERQEKSQDQAPVRMILGGAYRVPQQGQLQIVIKNPNKTAVKLFLVPYDLQGMEPGTKTFVRQRSFSSGPIIEGALSDKSQSPDSFDPLKDKNILRYLIHIKFCCPSKGKFYLYDDIRVVFANRVPDGKEKLRNEVQLPEPRYSPWRSVKTPQRSARSSVTDFPTATLSARNSISGTVFDDLRAMKLQDSSQPLEVVASVSDPVISHSKAQSKDEPAGQSGVTMTKGKTPFVFSDAPKRTENAQPPERALSPIQGFLPSTSQRSSPISWVGSNASTVRSFSPTPIEAGNGLLSLQFRELNSRPSSNRKERSSSPDSNAASTSLTKILSLSGVSTHSSDQETNRSSRPQ